MRGSDNTMRKWLEQRSLRLMMSLNEVPFTDDHDLAKLKLIREALREAAGELMARAARRAREELNEREAHLALAAKARGQQDE